MRQSPLPCLLAALTLAGCDAERRPDVAAAAAGGMPAKAGVPSASSLATVALRVHRMPEMVAFYAEAFGVTFRLVDTYGIQSQFGEVNGLTLKFVPIRNTADFDRFPVHQLGFEVPDVGAAIAIAERHGGRVQDEPVREGDRVHAAIRDPDGNTVELYGPQ